MALRPTDQGWVRCGRERLQATGPQFFASILALLLPVGIATSNAQTGIPDVIYSKQAVFRIPFEPVSGERRLRLVQLHVSEDQGQTWRPYRAAGPADRGFDFQATHDGLYWFTVQTVDIDNKAYPPNVQGTAPQLRVYVDTRAPEVNLRPAVGRDGGPGIEWDLRDDNLDLRTFSLECRPVGAVEWLPLQVANPTAHGEHFWNMGSSAVEIRLRVRDLAKNEGEGKLTLTPGLRPPWNDRDPGYPNRGLAGTRHVNSKRIKLNYEIREQGPSGVSAVELWATRNGASWTKIREETNPQPPFVFDVDEEGVYGFTIIVRSGVGTPSDRPPKAGDQPQVWVEVDLTKPMVQWVKAEPEPSAQPGANKVIITWSAIDKNLGRECITLKYSKDQQGPWTEIAKVENTGRYVWTMPPGSPWSFYVRVEATDKAGNVGFFDTPQPVKVDLVKPKGVILGVEPESGVDNSGSPSQRQSSSAIISPSGQIHP